MVLTKCLTVLLVLSLLKESCCSCCSGQPDSCCTGNPNIGKNIQEWFSTLGKLSDSVAKSCLDLPQADKLKKLEKEVKDVKSNCDTTEKNLNSFKIESNAAIESLQKQLKDLVLDSKDACLAGCVKKIKYGVLERKGHTCELKCVDGAYAFPARKFSCTIKDYFRTETPTCLLAKSCTDVLKYDSNAKSGVYKIFRDDTSSAYDVYCDMMTDQGGWTLVAVVANGDNDNWVYGSVDKDFGDLNSLWENAALLGKVDKDTATTGRDFKSLAFVDLKASELLVTLRGKSYIQTDNGCIGKKSLKQLFNVLRFSCAGGSYNCYFGKCLGKGGSSVSSTCTHSCNVRRFYPSAGTTGEPLSNGVRPTSILMKSGEADGAQDGNKDRVYISTFPFRKNVDYVPGIGSFTSLGSKLHRVDIGILDDVAKRPTDKTLFYGLYVR